MLQALSGRRKEEGFTLIELMVVVLIIGILVAIALPTFLGARNRANDKAAQSSLRNGIAAAKTCFTDADTYTGCDANKLATIETALNFVDSPALSTAPNMVSVSVPAALAGVQYESASWSKSGTCFFLRDNSQTGTFYGRVASAAGAGCNGTAAAGYTALSW